VKETPLGWNIEVMCIHDREKNLDLDHAVPDVFGPTGKKFGFEDATSVMRDGELCAGRSGEWVVVFDVRCKLSGADAHLEEVSAGRDVHVFRVANEPRHVHYRDGAKKTERRGLEDCAAALPTANRKARDGEAVAQELLHEETKLRWMTELWDADYHGFALD
jgi:hypothetical protein